MSALPIAFALALAWSGQALALQAPAPCGAFGTEFTAPGVDRAIDAWIAFDDGSGPAIHAGGRFGVVGDQAITGVARWNGANWSAVGAALPNVKCFAVFDDGAGPTLFAGGSFDLGDGAPGNAVVRWNGASWTAVGVGGPLHGSTADARAMTVFDDGSGPALYVAGLFRMPGVTGSLRAVRWNGTAWSAIGTGIPSGGIGRALAVFDDGGGPALYLGSDHLTASERMFRWSGSGWSALAVPCPLRVHAFATYVDASGPALYVGGIFGPGTPPQFQGIARFDGLSWSDAGGGVTAPIGPPVVSALAVHDDGGVARLYVGGGFSSAGGVPARSLARFDGTSWEGIGPDLASMDFFEPPSVTSLASLDDGSGSTLFVSGFFTRGGDVALANAGRWRSGAWEALTRGLGVGGWIEALEVHDDGTGEALYVGGGFETVGANVAQRIARWDGSAWSSVGPSVGADGIVNELLGAELVEGSGLYAAGSFTHIGGNAASSIAHWDGAQWTPLYGGLSGDATSLAVFDDGTGPALFVGGQFTAADGHVASNVARWVGASSGWSAVGTGTDHQVSDLVAFDDGSGPALWACGTFSQAGGVSVEGIARWTGSAWIKADAGIPAGSGQMDAFEVFDDGTGPALFVAGHVLAPGGTELLRLMRWDGATWQPVAGAPTDLIVALGTLRDAHGARLVVATSTLGGNSTATLHGWNGSTWTVLADPIRGGMSTGGFALASFDAEHDGVADLYVGGDFQSFAGVPASNFARRVSCPDVGVSVCAGDGSGAPCPCANVGGPGRGCANSSYGSGASLTSRGLASLSLDTLVLDVEGASGPSALFAQSTLAAAGGAGVPFDDGLVCVAGVVLRLGTRPLASGAASFGSSPGESVSATGLVVAPGTTRHYQVRYRNAAIYCTSGTANFSNARTLVWSF